MLKSCADSCQGRANEVELSWLGVDETWLEEEVIDTDAQLVKAGPSSGDEHQSSS